MSPAEILPLVSWSPLTVRELQLLGVVVIAVLALSVIRGAGRIDR